MMNPIVRLTPKSFSWSRRWLACAAFALSTATGFAESSYIYLESNNGAAGNHNSVYGLVNDGAGNLTMLPGSPYLSGGTGVIDPGNSGTDPFNADQQVVARPDGSALFAVNGHSNDISVFTINVDGTLTTVPGSPFPSGGQDPGSVGLLESPHSEMLVAVNKNEDFKQNIGGTVPNYTTFAVAANGSLTMNPGSTLPLTTDCSPAQALIQTSGRLLFGMEVNTAKLATYKISRTGLLTEVSAVNAPSASPFLGEILSPSKRVVYAGLPGTNEVAVYRYSNGGKLTLVTTVPNAAGSLVCWLALNAAGTKLYTSETSSGTISVFDLADPLTPVLLQTLTLIGDGEHPHNLALDPTGNFLYVQSGIELHVLTVAGDGTINEGMSPVVLPQPVTQEPIGLAVVRK